MPKKESKKETNDNKTLDKKPQKEEKTVKNDEATLTTSKVEASSKNVATKADVPEKVYSKSFIIFVSALSYIIFFLPFIVCKNEPFARYHLNQALLLWIFMGALYLILGFLPTINLIALPLIIMFHILGIMVGINYASRGKAKPLPLIGAIKLVKWGN